MKVLNIIAGPLDTNCYLLANELNNKCIIIDPGADPELIIFRIEENNFKPELILLTHTHFDHIGAVKQLQEKYKINFYFSRAEESLYKQQPDSSMLVIQEKIELSKNYSFIKEGLYNFATLKVKVIATPGHTIGSLSYYFEEDKILFSGDTLFYRSIGRTDFPTGNYEQLIYSIKFKLFKLPDDTLVYPGHDRSTTIGEEKRENTFV